MIIAVDFDGTLSMGPYPEIGNPKPYAVEMMNKLKDDGHYIISVSYTHVTLPTTSRV